jgi:hypothetical protein
MSTTPSSNIEKWSGFYRNEDDAQTDFENKIRSLAVKKLIVSAKKQLIVTPRTAKGMLLYNFVVVTANKS